MKHLQREDGTADWSRILGYAVTVLGLLPFLVWLYELVLHVAMHPGDDFNPAVSPKDVWYMVFPALAIGLGLAFGFGRELVNALIDRIRGG